MQGSSLTYIYPRSLSEGIWGKGLITPFISNAGFRDVEGGGSTSFSSTFTPAEKSSWHWMNKGLVGPQSRFGCFGEEKKIFPIPGIYFRFHGFLARNPLSIPTMPSQIYTAVLRKRCMLNWLFVSKFCTQTTPSKLLSHFDNFDGSEGIYPFSSIWGSLQYF